VSTARGDGQPEIPESFTFTGRTFPQTELNLIKQVCSDFQALGRTEISRTVCELLDWRRPNGSLKNHECRLLLEQLEELGCLDLPPVRCLGKRGPRAVKVTSQSEPELELQGSVGSYVPLRLEVVGPGAEGQSRLWRELIERYHDRHCRVPVGANLRYLVRSTASPAISNRIRFPSCSQPTPAEYSAFPFSR